MSMTGEEKVRSEVRAKILKALAHPSRIFIVEKLSERPFCVGELTGLIGADVSTVSKHLSILREAGVIDSKKQGTTVFYSLSCPCIMQFVGCLESVARRNYEKMEVFLNSES